jgi:hypothetical protein
MSAAKMGALVQYCNHRGVFIADVWRVGNVNIVRASRAVTMENLDREHASLARATHRLIDFPQAGFWRPDLGIFVVPEKQVKEIKSK